MQQASLQRVQIPPQLQPAIYFKANALQEKERFFTHNSTQPTSRQDDRQRNMTTLVFPCTKNHIKLVESPTYSHSDHNIQQQRRRKGSRQDVLESQRKFKCQRVEQAEISNKDSPRNTRRNKIFDSTYFSKQARKSEECPSLNHHSSAKNFLEHNRKPIFHPYNSKKSIETPQVHRKVMGNFIESIPIVHESRIVKVNSCSRLPQVQGSSNKITFTYKDQSKAQQQPQQPLLFSQPFVPPQHLLQPRAPPQQLLQPPIFSSIPNRSQPATPTSTAYPVYFTYNTNSQQIDANPVSVKIKRPNPTCEFYRKGTLIDQIQQNHSRSKVSFTQSHQYIQQNVGSKISLGNNMRQGMMSGSLVTEKLKLRDSISNIDEDNSQRYFDEEEGDKLFGQKKISYKNIDISSQNSQLNDQPQVQNIFSDFERSRRHERDKIQRENKTKSQIFEKESQPILQHSTLRIPDYKYQQNTGMAFPAFLIGVAALLLLIQMLS